MIQLVPVSSCASGSVCKSKTKPSPSLIGHFFKLEVKYRRSLSCTGVKEGFETAGINLESSLLFRPVSPSLNEWMYHQSESANFTCTPRLDIQMLF